MAGRRHSVTEVAAALRAEHGLITPTAKRLGIHRQKVYERIQRSAHLQAVLSEARETVIDLAENGLVTAVQTGEPWAIQLVLRTIGKARGYGEARNLDITSGGQPLDLAALVLSVSTYRERQAADDVRNGSHS